MSDLGFIKKAICWSQTLEHFGSCGGEEKANLGISLSAVFFPAMVTNSLLPLSASIKLSQDLTLTKVIPQSHLFLMFKKKRKANETQDLELLD